MARCTIPRLISHYRARQPDGATPRWFIVELV